MELSLDLASNIKDTRLDRQFTQLQLANESNYSRSEVGYIEQAITNPTLATLCAISEALDTHPAFLLGDSKFQTCKIKLGDYGIFNWEESGLRFMKISSVDFKKLINSAGAKIPTNSI